MNDPKLAPPVRMFALDVLRGLAVLMVLFRHMPAVDLGFPLVESGLSGLRRMGWVGVDLFFVLSGFLISGLLYKEIDRSGGLQPARFWMRRGLKIWPAYFFAYGSATLVDAFRMWQRGESPVTMLVNKLPNAIFIQNYLPPRFRWNHSWSVAIEEHFYFALPLVLMALLSLGRRGAKSSKTPQLIPGLIPFCIGVCSVVLIGRCWAVWGGAHWDEVYYPTHLRIDSLLFGVLVGYVFYTRRDLVERWRTRLVWAIPLGLAGLASAVVFNLSVSHLIISVGFTWLYLSSGILVAAAGANPSGGSTGWLSIAFRPLAFLGVYSYTIYLAHAVIDMIFLIPSEWEWLRPQMQHSARLSTIVDLVYFLFGSIVLGVLLSKLIETPFLRLRDRLYPSSRATAGTTKPPLDSGNSVA